MLPSMPLCTVRILGITCEDSFLELFRLNKEWRNRLASNADLYSPTHVYWLLGYEEEKYSLNVRSHTIPGPAYGCFL